MVIKGLGLELLAKHKQRLVMNGTVQRMVIMVCPRYEVRSVMPVIIIQSNMSNNQCHE